MLTTALLDNERRPLVAKAHATATVLALAIASAELPINVVRMGLRSMVNAHTVSRAAVLMMNDIMIEPDVDLSDAIDTPVGRDSIWNVADGFYDGTKHSWLWARFDGVPMIFDVFPVHGTTPQLLVLSGYASSRSVFREDNMSYIDTERRTWQENADHLHSLLCAQPAWKAITEAEVTARG